MSSGHYILNDANEPTEIDSVLEWAEWMGMANRQLRETHIGAARVSTVFLGIDHNFAGRGKPILWETMVFGGAYDEEQDRYSSVEQALAGHERMVEKVKRDPS